MEFTLLNVSFGLVFWSALTFLIVLYILKRYLWGPLVDNLDKRETMIRESIEKAEEARQKSEEAMDAYNEKLAEAREEVRKMIASGKEAAERTKSEIIEEADKRSKSLVEKAKKEIDAERKDALNQIKKVVVDISLSAAEKLIKRDLKAEDHMKLIEETMQSMEKKD